jgi:hypothetical protein
MGALLEHAGHLSEWVSSYKIEDINFAKCVRYVVIAFFKSSPDSDFTNEITNTAIRHQKDIQLKSDVPSVIKPTWIKELSSSPDDSKQLIETLLVIDSEWSEWIPDDTIATIMKSTITKML